MLPWLHSKYMTMDTELKHYSIDEHSSGTQVSYLQHGKHFYSCMGKKKTEFTQKLKLQMSQNKNKMTNLMLNLKIYFTLRSQ